MRRAPQMGFLPVGGFLFAPAQLGAGLAGEPRPRAAFEHLGRDGVSSQVAAYRGRGLARIGRPIPPCWSGGPGIVPPGRLPMDGGATCVR